VKQLCIPLFYHSRNQTKSKAPHPSFRRGASRSVGAGEVQSGVGTLASPT